MTKHETYAISKHQEAGKRYDGFNYLLHLKGVVAVAERYALQYFNSESDRDLVVQSCWYHDLIEDCGLSYNDLVEEKGKDVAEIVYAVSNELGKNRKERNLKTYPKIQADPLALFVKLCDRIANTLYSYYSGSTMFELYKREFVTFKEVLYKEGLYSEMWEELEKLYALK